MTTKVPKWNDLVGSCLQDLQDLNRIYMSVVKNPVNPV